jgi:hypothetical protein
MGRIARVAEAGAFDNPCARYGPHAARLRHRAVVDSDQGIRAQRNPMKSKSPTDRSSWSRWPRGPRCAAARPCRHHCPNPDDHDETLACPHAHDDRGTLGRSGHGAQIGERFARSVHTPLTQMQVPLQSGSSAHPTLSAGGVLAPLHAIESERLRRWRESMPDSFFIASWSKSSTAGPVGIVLGRVQYTVGGSL